MVRNMSDGPFEVFLNISIKRYFEGIKTFNQLSLFESRHIILSYYDRKKLPACTL